MTNIVKDWQELSRETVFEKYSRKIEKVIFKLPDGQELDYYIKEEGPAACVLALTADHQIILTRQYRPGPKKIIYELPGGFLDPQEDAQFTIRRELREETGYDGDIKFVTTCLDDAYSTMERFCFVATNCKKVQKPHLDDDEFIDVVLVSLAEFKTILRSGQMTDVEVGYLGLDYLNLNHPDTCSTPLK